MITPLIDVTLTIKPAAALTEPRKKCLGQSDGAEHVRVELTSHLFEWRFLQHALVTVSGIVDQHVDWPSFSQRL
ncbi:hypothetical protein AMC90_PD00913 (plasmid) [Rhizobium phaseoli]|nr:hypothetical protein AMC90_PD00913 [Rhizobium phaseoli]